jgi:hypothetical protein
MNKTLKSDALKMDLPFFIGAVVIFLYQLIFNKKKCPEVKCVPKECPKQEVCKTEKDVCVPCENCDTSNSKYCKETSMKYHTEYSNIMKKLYNKAETFTVLSEKDFNELFDDIDTFISLYQKVTGIDIELNINSSREEEKEWAMRYLQHLIDTTENPDEKNRLIDLKTENIKYRNQLMKK